MKFTPSAFGNDLLTLTWLDLLRLLLRRRIKCGALEVKLK